MRKRWLFALDASLLKTFFASRRTGSRKLRVYRHTYFNADPTAKIELHGRLDVGCRWERNRFLPSQLVLHPGATLATHGRFQIYTGCRIAINPHARLILGSGYINCGLVLDCFRQIEIGHEVVIGDNVTIRDTDTYTLNLTRPTTAPIRIGNHVWIAMNSTILKGVTIGDGAVVAAGSVVIRDVPPRSLVAGVPAVVKKAGVTWRGDPPS